MSLEPVIRAIRIYFIKRALVLEYRFLESASNEIRNASAAVSEHTKRIVNLEAQLRDMS